MLIHLSICNIVLIEKLDIQFEEGLSIFTGETGAGKSILLDCLALALGERGEGRLVRRSCDQGQVVAVFNVAFDHIARKFLRENDFDDDGDIILKRIQIADGRSRAFVNDRPVTVSFLRELGGYLVEIHGQHEDRVFIDVNNHRDMLDAYAGIKDDVVELKALYDDWVLIKTNLVKQRQKVEETKREAEFLRSAIEELVILDPKEQEEEFLANSRAKLSHLEKISSEIQEAEESLSGTNSPIPMLTSLWRRLERKSEQAPELITPITDALSKALDSLGYVQDHILEAIRNLGYDPFEMERIEERLFALRAAGRKYQYPANELHQLKAKYEQDLEKLDKDEAFIKHLEKRLFEAEKAYDVKAHSLSQKRRTKALDLRQAVLQELPALKLDKADLFLNIVTDVQHRRSDGVDFVEFWVQTNPGTQAGPMLKIVSGGELSRFLLALKVVMADKIRASTLVFDEIDTGVGGAVADAIGTRLYQLSKRLQVISITHAPQIAAKAHTHFLITKTQCDETESTSTYITCLSESERVEEIARMVSGSVITKEARAAAKQLLSQK